MDRREFLQRATGVLAVTGLPLAGLVAKKQIPSPDSIWSEEKLYDRIQVRWEGCNDPAFPNPELIEVQNEQDGCVTLVPPLKFRYIRFVGRGDNVKIRVYSGPQPKQGIWDGGHPMTKDDLLHIDDRLLHS